MPFLEEKEGIMKAKLLRAFLDKPMFALGG